MPAWTLLGQKAETSLSANQCASTLPCPNGATRDRCGICSGSGSSCLDCTTLSVDIASIKAGFTSAMSSLTKGIKRSRFSSTQKNKALKIVKITGTTFTNLLDSNYSSSMQQCSNLNFCKQTQLTTQQKDLKKQLRKTSGLARRFAILKFTNKITKILKTIQTLPEYKSTCD